MNRPADGSFDLATLRARLLAAWDRSDRLFERVADHAWLGRPIPLRHPPLFYLGHLPAFAWNQLGRGVLDRGSFHPTFDELFERGIDPLSAEAAAASAIGAWPARDEVLAYRDAVRQAVLAALPEVAARAGDHPYAARGRVVHAIVEHELMHHETFLYMLHNGPVSDLVAPAGGPAPVLGEARHPGGSVRVPGGPVTLGAAFDEVDFGWDNEFPATLVEVAEVWLDAVPVTVGAFADFVEGGGYHDPTLWDDADAAWRRTAIDGAPLEHPVSWRRTDAGGWEIRWLHGWLPLDAVRGWPVHVSHAEARAYARSQDARLPTEAELHRAAYTSPADRARSVTSRRWPWGDAPPSVERANLGFVHPSPVPVGSHPAGASAWGVHELVGNGWEWTSTAFDGLPGFQVTLPTYPGYSADFFDGAHHVVFGASWATAPALARRTFRNWYQVRYPFVFSTFRLVRSPS